MGAGSRRVDLAERPALINVWCLPCRDELPVLEAYSTSPGAVQVLGVQVQSDAADGLSLLSELGVRFPSGLDSDGVVSRAVRAPRFLPVSYVARPDGEVRRVEPSTPFAQPDEVRLTVLRDLS